MRKTSIIGIAIFFFCGLSTQEIMARGFGGGGGRGGGASFHGGGAANRSPSMSRPSSSRQTVNQPSRPANRQAVSKPSSPANRPSGPPKHQVASRPGTGPGQGSRPAGTHGDRMSRPTQGQVQQFLNLPQGQKPGIGSDIGKIGAGAVAGALGVEGARRLLEGQKPGNVDRPTHLPEKPGMGDRPGGLDRPSHTPTRPVSDQIRNNLQNRYDHAFTPQWWKDHPNAAHAYWDMHHDGWNHWWRPATWAAVTGLVAGAALAGYGEPVYYDYGDTVYYEGNDVYIDGQKTATADEYYQQASNLASTASAPAATDPQTEDWLPLGVFALSQGNAAQSNMVLQLALNKNGELAGTFYNTTTDAARPVRGMVDKKSQRAAWTFADGKNTDIIMETGIYNLTQDQTEALVHFGKDKTQQWLMVRLNEPEDKKKEDRKEPNS
ncbi:MAG: hypothetical protein V1897_01245 [Pseudomonadota bacterium]